MPSIELVMVIASFLLLLSIVASKISARVGVPALLLFILIGMLTGSDGPGGLWFDNYKLASNISVIALALILFSGGLDSSLNEIRMVFWPGFILSTVGVLATTGTIAIGAHLITGFDLMHSILIGAIISSTDAPAVFGILRSRQIGIPQRLRSLLEFESGSNDPMAICLTLGMVTILSIPSAGIDTMVGMLLMQLAIGAVIGWLAGKSFVFVTHRFRLEYEGLYPILTSACAIGTYGLTAVAGGSGYLAVYLMGIVIGNGSFTHKRSILRFHNAISWLMQIILFFTLGLLAFPAEIPSIALPAIGLSLFIMFVARPIVVALCLRPFGESWRNIAFSGWVGLKGAVAIVLATLPLSTGITGAHEIFNLVFVVVILSLLFQGSTIPWVAKKLGLALPFKEKKNSPISFETSSEISSDMVELELHDCSTVIGMRLRDLSLPEDTLVALIGRAGQYIVPRGDTVLEKGDTIFVLAAKGHIESIRDAVSKRTKTSCT
ncbi:MAG TPA: potassium/proton antiporter [Spirochaetota bacterium]|nr:potassium/proton antiporter [Spirochaetota bacterium]